VFQTLGLLACSEDKVLYNECVLSVPFEICYSLHGARFRRRGHLVYCIVADNHAYVSSPKSHVPRRLEIIFLKLESERRNSNFVILMP